MNINSIIVSSGRQPMEEESDSRYYNGCESHEKLKYLR